MKEKEKNSTKLLLDKRKENEIKDPNYLELLNLEKKIKWFEENLNEVNGKVNNNENYKSNSYQVENELNKLRKDWNTYKHTITGEESYNIWIEKEVKKIKDELSTKYNNIISKNQYDYDIYRPIVWGIPNVIRTYRGFEDDFFYCGKKENKKVYIPFTDIHKKLTESNWIINYDNWSRNTNGENHLLAHIVFIFSYEYCNDEKGKAIFKKRGFIDFPIVSSFEILSKILNNQEFSLQAGYDKFIERNGNDEIGKYVFPSPEHHSERAFCKFLQTQNHVQEMLELFEKKLVLKYFNGNNNNKKFKLSGIALFINSERNICNSEVHHCEKDLYNLMTSKEEGSFLFLIKQKLESIGFCILKKNNEGLPNIFITISAYKCFNGDSSGTLKNDAKEALKDDKTPENYRQLSINIKQLSGKIILSTSEKWLDNKSIEERKEIIKKIVKDKTAKIPFYSGFKSGKGIDNGMFLVSEEEPLHYDLPKCFDGIPIIGDIPDSET